jgi:hypothetical protein
VRRSLAAMAMMICGAAVLPAQIAPPPGWAWNHDVRGASADSAGWRFEMMPPGFHLTTTTTGVTLFPSGSTMAGRRVAETKVILFPGAESGPYGLVVLDPEYPQAWQGVLVERNGAVRQTTSIRGRVLTVGSYSRHEAMVIPDSSGFATNILRVEIDADSALFLANGKRIGAIPRGELPANAEVGFRLGERLNMHITTFDLITPLAPARKR